jgi:hypothetical protein
MTPISMRFLRLILGFAPWLAFLVLASLAVVGFHNVWTARHRGILAPGALAIGTWITLAIGRPFTLDYAREQTDPSLWNDPGFLRTNRVMTATWGLTFTINALLAVGKPRRLFLPDLGYELISYGLMLAAAWFTTWYPGVVRRLRQRQA